MEFDLYTEDGLKSSAVTYGSNSADFSKAESTCIIPTAATSTSVTLPDFKAKYLRWQLFDSETATTPVTTITNILSNSSSLEKVLIWFTLMQPILPMKQPVQWPLISRNFRQEQMSRNMS